MSRAALVVLLMAHVLGGCDSEPAGSGAPLPSPVTVARPLEKTITEWDEYTGRFTAVETVEVRARVSGFIDPIHFKEGQSTIKSFKINGQQQFFPGTLPSS
jgi:multidrug efflux system membrane fusion protein